MPVLLSAGTPVVRQLLKRRARVLAFRPLASGRVRIKPTAIRPGDGFTARVLVRAGTLRRARRQGVPSLGARNLRLTKRASALSSDELTPLVLSLRTQLAALSERTDQLSAQHASDMAGIQGQLDILAARVAALASGLGELQTAFA